MARTTRPVVANAKLNEAETELRAQIDRARQFGVRLSHLDTHMGTLLDRPDLLELYVNLGIEYKLPVMFTRRRPIADMEAALSGAARPRASRCSTCSTATICPCCRAVLMFYEKGEHEARKRRYLDAFETLPQGVSQVIVHCGIDNPELERDHHVGHAPRQRPAHHAPIPTSKRLTELRPRNGASAARTKLEASFRQLRRRSRFAVSGSWESSGGTFNSFSDYSAQIPVSPVGWADHLEIVSRRLVRRSRRRALPADRGRSKFTDSRDETVEIESGRFLSVPGAHNGLSREWSAFGKRSTSSGWPMSAARSSVSSAGSSWPAKCGPGRRWRSPSAVAALPTSPRSPRRSAITFAAWGPSR